MHRKNIKRIVTMQLKYNYPRWKKMKRKFKNPFLFKMQRIGRFETDEKIKKPYTISLYNHTPFKIRTYLLVTPSILFFCIGVVNSALNRSEDKGA